MGTIKASTFLTDLGGVTAHIGDIITSCDITLQYKLKKEPTLSLMMGHLSGSLDLQEQGMSGKHFLLAILNITIVKIKMK